MRLEEQALDQVNQALRALEPLMGGVAPSNHIQTAYWGLCRARGELEREVEALRRRERKAS